MTYKDDLVEKANQEHKKLRKQKPTISETNIAYFLIMLFCCATITLLPLLNKLVNEKVFIAFSVMSLVLSIVMFVFAFMLSKKSGKYKLFYYLDFMFIALGAMFAILALTTYYDYDLKIGAAFAVAGILLVVSAIDLLILCAGKRERLLFSLASLLFVGASIAGGIILYQHGNTALGAPMFAFSLIMLFLHLTMLIYVCGGDGFFELMSFSYLFIAIIVLVIALIAISGSGDCDCGGCDCADLGGGGGRRAKNKINRM